MGKIPARRWPSYGGLDSMIAPQLHPCRVLDLAESVRQAAVKRAGMSKPLSESTLVLARDFSFFFFLLKGGSDYTRITANHLCFFLM